MSRVFERLRAAGEAAIHGRKRGAGKLRTYPGYHILDSTAHVWVPSGASAAEGTGSPAQRARSLFRRLLRRGGA